MGKIRARKDTGKLLFDFFYCGVRCREQTALKDTPANRRKLKKIMERIDAEITLGTFEYEKYFPQSPMAKRFKRVKRNSNKQVPKLVDFAQTWLAEMKIQWKPSHYETVEGILRKYIFPAFAHKRLDEITKSDVLNFRTSLSEIPGRGRKSLSPSRINHIMNPLRMILNEAGNRYNFLSPYIGIKSLKVPKSEVEPFTLEEVNLIINNVRRDFRNYYIVRFFTGMRSSEIDGLQWKYVDFQRRQILIHQALVRRQLVYTKTDSSFRTIDMAEIVFNALKEQQKATGQFEFVFCTSNGRPLNQNNVNKRIWYPLLDRLGLRRRRPYQTRHTAATLWLAAGENPEWIARQLGHSNTEMLFRVYSRFVPNLTRRDGSAFERMLRANLNLEAITGGV